MYKIMFVCHGNICRSPMAEFICKKMVQERGREEDFLIASSAVSTDEIWNGVGNLVYPPARAELKKHGISCVGKRAQLLTKADGEKYDWLLCMDEGNLHRAKRIVGTENAEKCKKLLSFAGEFGDVEDPWFTKDFAKTYEDLLRGIEAFLNGLE